MLERLGRIGISSDFAKNANQGAQAMRSMGREAQGLAGFLEHAERRAVTFTAAFLGFRAITGVFGAVSEGVIGFNAKLEQSAMSWEVMLKSADKGRVMMEDIQKLALESPFRRWDLEVIAKQMAAAGVGAGSLIPLLKDIGNITSAYAGTSTDALERITKGLTDMASAGRVNAQDMRQLTNAGVPAWKILSEAIGETEGKTRQMAAEGKISADVMIAAFRKFSQENFGDMMSKQSNTFIGAWNNIQDALLKITARIGEPIFKRFRDLSIQLKDFVTKDEFGPWAANMAAYVEIVMRALDALARVFATTFGIILDTVLGIGQAIYTAMQWINPFARHSPALVDQVRDGIDLIVAKFGDLHAIVGIFEQVGAVMVNFGEVAANAFQQLETHDLEEKLGNISRIFGPDVAAVFSEIDAQIKQLRPDITALNREIQEQEQVVKATKTELDGINKAIRENDQAVRDLKAQYRDLLNQERDLNSQLDTVQAQLAAVRAGFIDKRNAVEDARNAVEDARVSVQSYQDRLESLRRTLGDNNEELGRLRDRLRDLTSGDTLKGTDDQRKRLQQLKDQAADLQVALELKQASGAKGAQLEPMQRQLAKLNAQARQLENQMERAVRPARDAAEAALNAGKGTQTPQEAATEAGKVATRIADLEKQRQTLQDRINTLEQEKRAPEEQLRLREAELRDRERTLQLAERSTQDLVRQEAQIQGAIAQTHAGLIPYNQEMQRLKDQRDDLIEQKDAINDALQDQEEHLSNLKELYSDVTREVREWNQALNDLAQGAAGIVREQEAAARKAEAEARKAAKNNVAGSDSLRGGDIPDLPNKLADLNRQVELFNAKVAELAAATKPFFEFMEGVRQFAANAEPAIRAVTTLVTSMLALRGIQFLIGLFAKFVSAINPWVLAVSLGARAWIELYNRSAAFQQFVDNTLLPALGRLRDIVEGSIGKLVTWLQNVGIPAGLAALETFLTNNLVPALEQVGDFIENHIAPALQDFADTKVGPGLEDMGNTLTDTVLPALGQFKDFLGDEVIPRLGDLKDWLGDNVLPVLGAFKDFIIDDVVPALGSLAGWIGDNVIPALGAFKDFIGDNVLPMLGNLKDFIGTNLLPQLGRLKDWFVNDALPALGRFKDMIGNDVLPKLGALKDFIADHILPVLGALKDLMKDHILPLWGEFKDAIAAKLMPELGKLKDFIGDQILPKLGALKDFIADYVMPVLGTLTNFIGEQILDKMGKWYDLVKNLIELYGQLIDKVREFVRQSPVPNGQPPPAPSAPTAAAATTAGVQPLPLAGGGLVTRPTLAMIGENEPELVIPLSKVADAGDTGGTVRVDVSVYVTNSGVIAGDDGITQLKNIIRDGIMDDLDRAGIIGAR